MEFDLFVPAYRRAVARWPSSSILLGQYKAIRGLYESKDCQIDYVKAFVECVCLTLLSDRGVKLEETNPATTTIVQKALDCVGLSKVKEASGNQQILSGFFKIAAGVARVRNDCGIISHGKDAYTISMASGFSHIWLLAAGALLELLLSAHEGYAPDIRHTRQPYRVLEHLHGELDKYARIRPIEDEDGFVLRVEVNEDSFVELPLSPSEILFAHDRSAYVELLATARDCARQEDDEA